MSVGDSNGIQIEIRAHLRARDIERITLGQKCPSATVPTRRHTRRQRVGVQSDTTRWKTSKFRAKTPTLGSGHRLETLLFLGLTQKVTGSGRNRYLKIGRNPI